MVFFDNCGVSINGSGILAESVGFSMQNSLQSFPALGYKIPSTQIPTDFIRGSLSISYFAERDNEPNIQIINKIKSGEQFANWSPEQIIFGNITGSGYLENYSLKITPLDQAKATANYGIFIPSSGQMIASKSSRNPLFSGVADGWNTVLSSPGEVTDTLNLFDFTYSFRAAWQPVYVIGNTLPIQTQLLNGEESLSLLTDTPEDILFSGSQLTTVTNNYTGISLNLYRQDSSIAIPFNDFILKSAQTNGSLEDVVKVTLEANRFF